MRKTKWLTAMAVLACLGLGSCSAVANSDGGGPKEVRVQHYQDAGRDCLIFTHDTMQGASVAVDCRTVVTK
jgi:hypothetical protein